jgi:hypothetical protein
MANLLDDWTAHGRLFWRKWGEISSTYLRVAFSTIPKDSQITVEHWSRYPGTLGRPWR